MYEPKKALLKRLCRHTVPARRQALADELDARNIRYEDRDGMALVVPSASDRVIVLCAHFDAVAGSCGYNDNGMALVTALDLLPALPAEAEVVFTNGEERGGLGAAHYLRHARKRIGGCVNLDVVGCFDQVYLDPMNCGSARSLKNCKQGNMPFSDACIFAEAGIPSVCFSSGPSDTAFCDGIMQIFSTIHNQRRDNDFSLLNFAMPDKVGAEVRTLFQWMKGA